MVKKLEKKIKDPKLSNSEIYIQFYYPEIKDLSKSFLSLVSAILAFSVTFSTSIIGFPSTSSTQLTVLICAWISFVIAIITTGAGLYLSFRNANIANRVIKDSGNLKIGKLLTLPYILLTIAGCTFVVGLVLLAIAGGLKFIG